MAHSCDSPFGLQSYCLLVTNSFSGPDRMDNLLKDHRCPILSTYFVDRVGKQAPQPAETRPRSLALEDLGNHRLSQRRRDQHLAFSARENRNNPTLYPRLNAPPYCFPSRNSGCAAPITGGGSGF